MKRTTLLMLLLCTLLFSDVKMKHQDKEEATIPEHPIERPERPFHKPHFYHDYIPTGIIIETQADCSRYIDMIRERDTYINELERKLASMQLQLQTLVSERNKAAYEQERKQMEKRKSSIPAKSKIIISDKPEK
jgi:hypothetical protein